MLSFITASNRFVLSPWPNAGLNCPAFRSFVFVVEPRRRKRRPEVVVSVNFVAATKSGFRGFSDLRESSQGCWWPGFARRCKGWDGEGDLALEAEILEFMKKSENPEVFPTKKRLEDAGRMDLVEAIVKQGGWLSLGWDLDDDGDKEEAVGGEEVTNEVSVMAKGSVNGCLAGGDSEVIEESANTNQESGALEDRVSSFSADSCHLASSSGRSLEMTPEDEMGIEGILSRLEKQRNMSFGLGLKERENSSDVFSNDGRENWHPRTPDKTVADRERGSRPASLSNADGWRNLHQPEMWRTWSIQRAGFSGTEFEAGEIAFNESRIGGPMDASKDGILSITDSAGETLDRRKEFNSCGKEIKPNQIQSRLQHLELELSSVLHLLRSKTDEVVSQKGHVSPSDNLQTLSDAWEFQENEIMNAQDRLRSIRAKLAVLEGKMALTIIEAQKIAEEKQKKIDDARKSLRLLHTACIVWPNSASEVLLAGSYDGWATQRKMERSNTGIFSLCLKLYPGKYEIKFIVDGTWRIDPLRPIVHNNGYENNLLIIT